MTKTRLVVAAGVAVMLPVLLWVCACAVLWAKQDELLFAGTPLEPGAVLPSGPDILESAIDVPGARLSVLQLRLAAPDGVVFFLHGNGGNLRDWFVNAEFYRHANFDLVMMDYRGYGKSTGSIASEEQLHADVEAVWRAVASRYQGRRVVIYGRSLGSALAAALAARVQPDLTVLVSPFESIAEIARQSYPWAPAFLLRFPLRTDLLLPRIRTPVLLMHGDRDALIPVAHSRILQRLARNSRLVVVPGAGHNDMHESDVYRRYLRNALAQLAPTQR